MVDFSTLTSYLSFELVFIFDGVMMGDQHDEAVLSVEVLRVSIEIVQVALLILLLVNDDVGFKLVAFLVNL